MIEKRINRNVSVQSPGPAASLAAFRAASPNFKRALAHDFVTRLNAYNAGKLLM